MRHFITYLWTRNADANNRQEPLIEASDFEDQLNAIINRQYRLTFWLATRNTSILGSLTSAGLAIYFATLMNACHQYLISHASSHESTCPDGMNASIGVAASGLAFLASTGILLISGCGKVPKHRAGLQADKATFKETYDRPQL